MENFGNLFWQAYLVNFLFWGSLAQGSVIFSASLNITNARWGRPYVNISRSFAAFLPVWVILFAVLMLGRNFIFPWIEHPIPQKAAYLNVPFLLARGLLGPALLTLLSWLFLIKTRRASAHSEPAETSPWAVLLAISFMGVFSYLAFDLVMSLQPHWYSTLLGAHFALSAFFLGIAGLCLAGFLVADVPQEDMRRMAKLLFAFSLFWISLLWSQYIVIWYGNIPEETQFVYIIFAKMPWKNVTLLMIALAFVFPFLILMPQKTKFMRFFPLLASLLIIAGMLLEKVVLVIPSFHPDSIAVTWVHLLVTILFGLLFYASYTFLGPLLKLGE